VNINNRTSRLALRISISLLASSFILLCGSCMSAEEKAIRETWDLLQSRVSTNLSIYDLLTSETKAYLDEVAAAYRFYGFMDSQYSGKDYFDEIFADSRTFFIPTLDSESLDSVTVSGNNASVYLTIAGEERELSFVLSESWKLELLDIIREKSIMCFGGDELLWDAFVAQEVWYPVVIQSNLGDVLDSSGRYNHVTLEELYWKKSGNPTDSDTLYYDWTPIDLELYHAGNEETQFYPPTENMMLQFYALDSEGYTHESPNISYTRRGSTWFIEPDMLRIENGLSEGVFGSFMVRQANSSDTWTTIDRRLPVGGTFTERVQAGDTLFIRGVLLDGIQTYTSDAVHMNRGISYVTLTDRNRDPLPGETPDNPVPLGAWATDFKFFDTQQFRIRVADVMRGGPALRKIQAENRFFSPSGGYEYLILKLEVDYPDDGRNQGSVDFGLYGRDLYYNGQLVDDEINLVLYPRFGDLSLMPGGSSWAYVYYEIPVSWGTPMLMLGANMFTDQGGIYYSLR